MTVLHVSLIVGVLITAVLIGHLLRQRRSPAATVGWIIFMISAPWLAVPVYLTLGTRKLAIATPSVSTADPVETGTPLMRLLASAGLPPPRHGNAVIWHANGESAWTELMEMVAGSTRSLDVLLFLLRDDAYGTRFMDSLAARAQAGVQVRLLIDGIGSLPLARRSLQRLRQAGVQTAWFIPLLHRPLRGRTNLRNHRKLVIADHARAWTGGRNVADEYFAADDRWIDLSFSIAGPAVADLANLFAADWAFTHKQTEWFRASIPPAAGDRTVQIVPSGPALARDTLHELMLTALWRAPPHLDRHALFRARRSVTAGTGAGGAARHRRLSAAAAALQSWSGRLGACALSARIDCSRRARQGRPPCHAACQGDARRRSCVGRIGQYGCAESVSQFRTRLFIFVALRWRRAGPLAEPDRRARH